MDLYGEKNGGHRLRIGLFGQSGPFAPMALRELLGPSAGSAGADWEVVLVVEGRRKPMGRSNHRWQMPVTNRKSMGSLPRTQGLAELALAAGIPVFQTCDVNSVKALRELSKIPFDLLICVGFDCLFKQEVLHLPARGAWNCHPSFLPDLRGPAPIFWALKRGDTSIGVSIHQLDLREDNGPLLHQGAISLQAMDTGSQIFERVGKWVGRELQKVLAQELLGQLRAVPQGQPDGPRATRVKPEDVFVEPRNWSCGHLVRFACGAPYFRAPWLRMGEDTYYIRRGIEAVPGRKIPAQYALVGSELFVGCADGVARLEIQT